MICFWRFAFKVGSPDAYAVVIKIEEIDGNVVVNGSGSISTTNGLTTDNIVQSGANQHFVRPATATILTTSTLIPNWTGANTPSDFSTSTQAMRAATSFSGSDFGVSRVGIALSREYVFGDPIVFSMTFANQTLDSLAMRSGTYDWSWGSADDGDSVRLCVGNLATCSKQEPEPPAPTAATPVPTVGAIGLIGLASALGLAGIAMTRRRKQ